MRNKKEAIIKVLKENLSIHEAEEDIDYWIQEAIEDFEE